MFGLGKKKQEPTRVPRTAGRQAPLRYLSARQTVQYGQNIARDVRGLEGIAYPVVALIALLTYRGERKRQAKAQEKADRAAIHQRLLATYDPDAGKKRKRFIFF
jgi:hypothetical protein